MITIVLYAYFCTEKLLGADEAYYRGFTTAFFSVLNISIFFKWQ